MESQPPPSIRVWLKPRGTTKLSSYLSSVLVPKDCLVDDLKWYLKEEMKPILTKVCIYCFIFFFFFEKKKKKKNSFRNLLFRSTAITLRLRISIYSNQQRWLPRTLIRRCVVVFFFFFL